MIKVYKNDNPYEVAFNFSKVYGLKPEVCEKLTKTIINLIYFRNSKNTKITRNKSKFSSKVNDKNRNYSVKSSKTNANVYSRALWVLFGRVVMCVLSVEFNSPTVIILDMQYETYTIFTQIKYSFGMKKLFRGKAYFMYFSIFPCMHQFIYTFTFFFLLQSYTIYILIFAFYLCLLLSRQV